MRFNDGFYRCLHLNTANPVELVSRWMKQKWNKFFFFFCLNSYGKLIQIHLQIFDLWIFMYQLVFLLTLCSQIKSIVQHDWTQIIFNSDLIYGHRFGNRLLLIYLIFDSENYSMVCKLHVDTQYIRVYSKMVKTHFIQSKYTI